MFRGLIPAMVTPFDERGEGGPRGHRSGGGTLYRGRGGRHLASGKHRRALSLVTLGAHSDPPMGAIKLAMKKLGVPISPTVRAPALPATEEAHTGIENALRDAELLPVSKEV
jgi:dihydrodipicolinate synthase/N-acetylneuraminate lyase